MKPSLARTLMTLAGLAGAGIAGGVEPGGPPRRLRQFPVPLPDVHPSAPRIIPAVILDRIYRAKEKLARKAAKLEAAVAKGAIRKFGASS